MTKEELEREARINLKRRFGEFFPQLTISYVMGAEPREKRIADLEQLNSNQAESLRVIMLEEEKKRKQIEELEQQIEKMKCCGNCNNTWNGMKLNICEDCKDHSKWELKEND